MSFSVDHRMPAQRPQAPQDPWRPFQAPAQRPLQPDDWPINETGSDAAEEEEDDYESPEKRRQGGHDDRRKPHRPPRPPPNKTAANQFYASVRTENRNLRDSGYFSDSRESRETSIRAQYQALVGNRWQPQQALEEVARQITARSALSIEDATDRVRGELGNMYNEPPMGHTTRRSSISAVTRSSEYFSQSTSSTRTAYPPRSATMPTYAPGLDSVQAGRLQAAHRRLASQGRSETDILQQLTQTYLETHSSRLRWEEAYRQVQQLLQLRLDQPG